MSTNALHNLWVAYMRNDDSVRQINERCNIITLRAKTKIKLLSTVHIIVKQWPRLSKKNFQRNDLGNDKKRSKKSIPLNLYTFYGFGNIQFSYAFSGEGEKEVEVEKERQVQRRLYMILNYGKHHVQMFVWTISDALLSYPIELKFIRIKFYIGKFSLVYDNINLNMHTWWSMIKIRMQCWMFEPVLLKRLSKSIITYIKKT